MLRYSTILAHFLACLLFLPALAGCSDGPTIAPVQGRVLLDGEPLTFGGVMFQPPAGQPARGDIQPDGTFELTTNQSTDGATVGVNRVRVTCFESQNPSARAGEGERTLGRSLIPNRYTDINTSGLTVEVLNGGNSDVVIELASD